MIPEFHEFNFGAFEICLGNDMILQHQNINVIVTTNSNINENKFYPNETKVCLFQGICQHKQKETKWLNKSSQKRVI